MARCAAAAASDAAAMPLFEHRPASPVPIARRASSCINSDYPRFSDSATISQSGRAIRKSKSDNFSEIHILTSVGLFGERGQQATSDAHPVCCCCIRSSSMGP
jgi:hypothetical protein